MLFSTQTEIDGSNSHSFPHPFALNKLRQKSRHNSTVMPSFRSGQAHFSVRLFIGTTYLLQDSPSLKHKTTRVIESYEDIFLKSF
ncbi:hypothetical protein CEXT_406421 [Caerostris extrusa]|uniref:Uncharacterized protein n=1 Tax=Caerostris extrusa TaxID=172846 RepID=A0AAV4QMS0_CAEEX|nr:hypothetical protein CEXT_406421 [Caerostris extrusa]